MLGPMKDLDMTKLSTRDLNCLKRTVESEINNRKHSPISSELINELREEYDNILYRHAKSFDITLRIPQTYELELSPFGGDVLLILSQKDDWYSTANLKQIKSMLKIHNPALLDRVNSMERDRKAFDKKLKSVSEKYDLQEAEVWDRII